MRNGDLLLSALKSLFGLRRTHTASDSDGGVGSNRGLAVLLPRVESSEQQFAAIEDGCKPRFVPSFKPFKAEKKRIAEWEDSAGVLQWRDKYPYGYRFDLDTLSFKEMFRSAAEREWVRTFDRIGLRWEYEPLKFDMGPDYVSYTPDFRIADLSVRDSARPLFIEVKVFPDEIDLTKYVRFTDWYNSDLLVLAHEKGGVLNPPRRYGRGSPVATSGDLQNVRLLRAPPTADCVASSCRRRQFGAWLTAAHPRAMPLTNGSHESLRKNVWLLR